MSQYEANPNTPQVPPQNQPVNQMPYGNGGRPPMPPQQGYGPQNQYPPQQPVYPNGYQGAPYYQPPQQPQQPQQPKKGNGGKIVLILLCVILAIGIALLLADKFGLLSSQESQTQNPQGSQVPYFPEDNYTAPIMMPAITEAVEAPREEHIHQWMDATYQAPQTCASCGATQGERLKPDPIYLNEMPYLDKVGKLWTSGEYAVEGPVHTSAADLTVWKQESIPGHTQGPVYDNYGNRYSYGMFLDGSITTTYFISYNLEGKYTDFSCYVAFPGNPLSKRAKESIKKVIEFYVDGELVAVTPEMSINAARAYISFDVTDGQILTIQYTKVDGNNEAATIFDPLLR